MQYGYINKSLVLYSIILNFNTVNLDTGEFLRVLKACFVLWFLQEAYFLEIHSAIPPLNKGL